MFIKKMHEDSIHIVHEDYWNIGHTKRYNQGFIVVIH